MNLTDLSSDLPAQIPAKRQTNKIPFSLTNLVYVEADSRCKNGRQEINEILTHTSQERQLMITATLADNNEILTLITLV